MPENNEPPNSSPTTPPSPDPEPTRERRAQGGVTCEFCNCKLFADGTVKTKSEEAKKFSKLADENDSLKAEIAEMKRKEQERIDRETSHHEPPSGRSHSRSMIY